MKDKPVEHILLTWHYTRYGIAYLKHILSEFSKRGSKHAKIEWDNIAQMDSNAIFDHSNKKDFVFDKTYYLTAPQSVFDHIANRKKYRAEILSMKQTQTIGLTPLWEALLAREAIPNPSDCPNLTLDKAFVKTYFPEKYDLFMEYLWQNVQYYTIDDQIKWFLEDSNAKNYYTTSNFEVYDTKVKNLQDVQNIATQLRPFLKQLIVKYPNAHYFINISLGSKMTPIVWYALNEAGLLPTNRRFLQTYEVKTDLLDDNHFNPIRIQEVPTNTFEKLVLPPIYDDPQSQKRKIADLLMEHFMKNGFAILILGERGIGKSVLASKYKASKKVIVANCASFDDDTKAESELFGHKRGAFTGADKDKNGLFQEADDQILFLDEIHHLSKRVQAKLMKALDTDEHNFFKIRALGSTEEKKIRCTVIFATNRTIDELRNGVLYEDFFDRIAQNLIELPALRDTPEDREKDWNATWARLKFGSEAEAPQNESFLKWLKKLPLYGNFRDLQKIALYYNNFTKFKIDLIKLLPTKNAFEYTKSEFEKLQSRVHSSETAPSYFDENKSIKTMQQNFNKGLADWAIQYFGSAQKAVDYFNEKGDKTTVETLYRWRNSK